MGINAGLKVSQAGSPKPKLAYEHTKPGAIAAGPEAADAERSRSAILQSFLPAVRPRPHWRGTLYGQPPALARAAARSIRSPVAARFGRDRRSEGLAPGRREFRRDIPRRYAMRASSKLSGDIPPRYAMGKLRRRTQNGRKCRSCLGRAAWAAWAVAHPSVGCSLAGLIQPTTLTTPLTFKSQREALRQPTDGRGTVVKAY
jgi:hypothetical protein